MKYLHTMYQVKDLNSSLQFFSALGLREVKRHEVDGGRVTLVLLAAPGNEDAQIELTHHRDESGLSGDRNLGHVAYEVDDVYAHCQRLQDAGITINQPPRDGRMAFLRTSDGISIELFQRGDGLPPAEPWASMPDIGLAGRGAPHPPK
jgi:lactoylglutathione lyase